MGGYGVQMDVEAHLARIEADGYTVLSDVIPVDVVDALVDDLDRLEEELSAMPSDNSFEGGRTTRIYNLLAFGGPWVDVPVHPDVVAMMQGVLGSGPLISSISSIAIGPGERAQPVHADDQAMPLERPHRPIVCNSMWALTEFTEANGATRLVPGSHKRDHSPPYDEPIEGTIPAEMSKGSILVWNGSLWHGGGANTTDETRIGIAMNYCAGWIRQQENQQLGIPADVMADFSPELRDLCGLGVYKGLIGHIDKRTPADRLYGDTPVPNLFDIR